MHRVFAPIFDDWGRFVRILTQFTSNRSALEWVIDQYQVSVDKRSGIVSDPNSLEDEEYIVRLVGRVVTMSVETVGLVGELAGAVRMEDWISEITE